MQHLSCLNRLELIRLLHWQDSFVKRQTVFLYEHTQHHVHFLFCFLCIGRRREAAHVGRQLSGSDWFSGRELCSRTPRGECGWGGGVGLLWVPPLGMCDRYNSQQSHQTTALRLYMMYCYALLLSASQRREIFTHLVNVQMDDSVWRWSSWPITESLSRCTGFWVVSHRCRVEGSTL